MRSFLNFLLGLLFGALLGAAIALLLAPASGEETREQLRSRADQVTADIRSAVEDERKRLEAELSALKHGEIRVA